MNTSEASVSLVTVILQLIARPDTSGYYNVTEDKCWAIRTVLGAE